MEILNAEALFEQFANIIHEDTQLHARAIDLTAGSVQRITGSGALDFGGSEFRGASTDTVRAEKEDRDDDYGWWKLGRGTYIVQFNETLTLDEDMIAIVNPHDHSRRAGLIANSQLVTERQELSMVFQVPEAGCHIKENARMAAACIINAG